ncbi:MAG: acyltransferase family protein [Mucilaginibacter sp.]
MKKLFQKLFSPITTVPEVLQTGYYPGLNGLRGISILIVLLAHFGINKYLYQYGLLIDSNTGVHIFFVISGFLITTLLLKEKLRNGSISLKYFYFRRVLRILPVAYLFLLVLVVLNIIFHLHITLPDFIQTACFAKNFPVNSSHYTAHFWSLAVEEQFYLVFPFLLAFSIDLYFFIALTIVTAIPLGCMLGYYCPSIFSSFILVQLCMYAFWKGPVIILMGSVFSILMFKNLITMKQRSVNYWLGVILLPVAIIIRTPTFLCYAKYLSEYLSAILIAFAIMFALQPGTLLYNVLSNNLMVWIGMLSYSLYIWQQLFIGANAWQPWMRSLRGYPLWQLIAIKLVAVFGIAICSYAFEKQFLKLKDKYKYLKMKETKR